MDIQEINYVNVPGHPEFTKSIFEPDADNCFFTGAFFHYSPLCPYDIAEECDIWDFKGGNVVILYERLFIVKNGTVIYRNPCPQGVMPRRNIHAGDPPYSNHCAGTINILSESVLEYIDKTYEGGKIKRTHYVLNEQNINLSVDYLNPEDAEKAATELSEKRDGVFIAAQAVRSVDRIFGF